MKSTVLLLSVLTLFVCGQLCALAQPDRKLSPKVSTKLDEYGQVGGCDQTARLDYLAHFLDTTPGATGYIFAYAPEGPAQKMLAAAKTYLIDARGISDNRITTVYGGRNDVLSEPRVQLWIGPTGARRPKPEKFDSKIETFQGLFAEYKALDDYSLAIEPESQEKLAGDVAGTGPAVGSGVNVSLAEVLKTQKNANAYIVSYNGEDAAPGAWRRVAQNQSSDLKDSGVDPSQIKIIFGGVAKETKVQLWVTPANAPAPVADAGPEPPPKKRATIGTFYDTELAYADVERAAFKRIIDSLKQFPSLRACLVVTLGTYKPDVEELPGEPEPVNDESEAEIQVEPEPDPVDVTKVVENWKNELRDKHKIGPDRFIVLFTYSDDFSNNMIDAYALPPGAPFPNPDELNEINQTLFKMERALPDKIRSFSPSEISRLSMLLTARSIDPSR